MGTGVDLGLLSIFVAVAETSSFSAAATRLGLTRFASGNSCLNRYRAFDRAGRALELNQQAISGRFDDAAVMSGYSRIDEFAAMRLVPGDRPNLIRRDQAAVGDHVGSHYCGKAALQTRSPVQKPTKCRWNAPGA